jgi:hypothetical protein
MDFASHYKVSTIRSGENDEILAISLLVGGTPSLTLIERPANESGRVLMPIILNVDEAREMLGVMRQDSVSHVALGSEDHSRTLEVGRNASGTGVEMIATDPEVVSFGQTTFEADIADGHDLTALIEILEHCIDLEHQVVATSNAKF